MGGCRFSRKKRYVTLEWPLKAYTEEHHRGLSAGSFVIWRAFISRSTDLDVSFGLPLLLFPTGVQRIATLVTISSFLYL